MNLQTKAQRAYPRPNVPAVNTTTLPGDGGVRDREHAQLDGQTATRAYPNSNVVFEDASP